MISKKQKKGFTKIQSLFLTNFGCAPEKKSTFLVQKQQVLHNFCSPIPSGGGAVFIFGAKIGLKSTKNALFCILFRPMGRATAFHAPLPPWLQYCTYLMVLKFSFLFFSRFFFFYERTKNVPVDVNVFYG